MVTQSSCFFDERIMASTSDATKPKIPASKRARIIDSISENSACIERVNNCENEKSDEHILDPIAVHTLTQTKALTDTNRTATPFPHGIIHEFCRESFLEDVIKELKENTKVKFKETDLFRVYQSIDLGNLIDGSESANKMPKLMKLKNALYSTQFRTFIEKINGLEEGILTNEVDCAANCHAKGCHLLCHDDVIGTRKVSFVIYLTDPEPIWKDEDGGKLELYDAIPETNVRKYEDNLNKPCVPDALPVKTILPVFNTMAYFVVQPGVSFHSVQEVFCDRPRLSLQGWYHTKELPTQFENATLQRLKTFGNQENTEGEFQPMTVDKTSPNYDGSENEVEACPLSQSDREFLGKYINAVYLNDDFMNEIRIKFEGESSVKLRHFLVNEWITKINSACEREDRRDNLGKDRPALNYRVGLNDDWKIIGPAHKQRFLECSSSELDNDCVASNLISGQYLTHLKQILFQSTAFGKWIGYLSSLGFPLGQRGRIRRFRPGLDYTVAHYGILTTDSVLDATLCFCGGDGNQCTFDEETNELIGLDDDAIWESGDFGGFECYIAADESGEENGPDAEYDEEDDSKLLSVSASNNTLSLVYRDPGTMRFIKYVGIGAPSSRWDIAFEYNMDKSYEQIEKL